MNIDVTVKVDDATLESVIRRGYDGEPGWTLGDAVAAEVVRRLTEDTDYWHSVANRVQQIRDEEVRARVLPLIEEALTEPFRKTDGYGGITGPETTLRALIVKEARDYLTKGTDSYDRASRPLINKLIKEQVDAAFKEEVAAAVKQVRESVAKQFGDSISEQFAAVAREALRSR